jgi:cyclase
MKRFATPFAFLLLCASLPAAQDKSAAQDKPAVQKPEKLAEGVWAMMTGGGSNAGWFIFGDSVIAVDSGRSPAEAEKILSAIADTTGKKPVSYLILTNDFTPHAGGAAVFARKGAVVVCQEKFGPAILGLLRGSSGKESAGRSHPAVMTLSQRLVFQTEGRHVEVTFPGPADSGGDLVVYVADAKVLFAGDLAETAILPPLFSAAIDPDGWQSALDGLLRLNVESLVPGYGPIGPVEGLRATRFYLNDAWETAKRIAAEKTPEDFLPTRLTEPDVKIKGLPQELQKSHEANVGALVKVLRARNASPPPR